MTHPALLPISRRNLLTLLPGLLVTRPAAAIDGPTTPSDDDFLELPLIVQSGPRTYRNSTLTVSNFTALFNDGVAWRPTYPDPGWALIYVRLHPRTHRPVETILYFAVRTQIPTWEPHLPVVLLTHAAVNDRLLTPAASYAHYRADLDAARAFWRAR